MKEMSKAKQIFVRSTAGIVLFVCALPAYHSARLGYAEYLFRSGEVEAMQRAAALTSSSRYMARSGHLKEAINANPYNSAAWMELGERAEIRGDATQAAIALAQAEQIDKTFEPAWALANFFFRQEQWEEFWKWIRIAAERSYGDRTGFFNLCWRTTAAPETILTRAIPNERQFLSEYVYFLVTSGRISAARSAARQLLPLADRKDMLLLLWLCDLLTEQEHDPTAALEVWNALIERGWVPHEKLNPSAGLSLTNGAFQVEPSGHGFDWKPVKLTGVRYLSLSSPPGFAVALDGHQPEQATILFEWIPVEPSSIYELGFETPAGELPRDSGLTWKLFTPANAVLGGLAFAPDAAAMRFRTGPRDSLVRLALSYQRPAGSVRLQGLVRMPHVSLRRNP